VRHGEPVVQETRLFDADRGITEPMRGKEEAMDYRYFPDPDLPPVAVDPVWLDALRAVLPELPHARRRRFIDQHGLSARDASYLNLDKPLADFYEQTAAASGNPRAAANWVISELMGRLNTARWALADSPVTPQALGALLKLIDDGTISGRIAKTVFDDMFETGGQPADIVRARGLLQISDEETVRAAVRKVIDDNPAQVATFRQGKAATFGWFVGQVMKSTGGKASPAVVNRILREMLEPR
jgi:aspartyl-tRNA(Asn)/glutamyl-tRNA(Gln) amidotransferase subunit B